MTYLYTFCNVSTKVLTYFLTLTAKNTLLCNHLNIRLL